MKSFIHIIPTLHSGGGEKLLALTCEFVDANHHIICLSKPGLVSKIIERNGAIIYYPFKLGLDNIKIIALLFNAFLDGKYVCQGWMYYGDLIAVFIQLLSFGRIQGRLFLLTNAFNNQISFGSRISRNICSFLSKIIKLKIFAISKTSLDSHISLGYGKNNFQLLLPPIVPKNKKKFEEILKIKRERRKESKILKIIMAARFDPVKNHKLALKLFDYFKGEFILDFYGNGMNYENLELKNLIKKTLINSKDCNLGLKGEVPDLLSKFVDYDYILLTSTQEGLPITIIEASQNALIPIASKVGDTIDAASGYGFFFESNIFSDLVEKFKKAKLILDKDSDKNNYSEYYQISRNIYEESNSRWKLNQYLRIFMS